jgi:hypothetical protein
MQGKLNNARAKVKLEKKRIEGASGLQCKAKNAFKVKPS